MQLLLFPILALLLAAAIFLIFNFTTGETQIKLEEPVYQFFTDQKAEYDTGTKLVPEKGDQLLFEEGTQQNSGDVTPIYYTDSAAILLPVDMSWMDPGTNREWCVPALSRLELDESGIVWYRGKEGDRRMESGFLSNGRGTYVFLDTVDLICNGAVFQVGPFSFYSASSGLIRIYQYETDTLTTEDVLLENVTIRSHKGYQADLSVGIYTAADGSQRLLAAAPGALKEIGAQ